MALDASQLASDLETGIRSAFTLGATPYPRLTQYCNVLATTIVDHFKNHAEINNGKTTGAVVRTPADAASYAFTNQPVTGGIK